MFEEEEREVLDAALEIRRCNLIPLLGGNVSTRAGGNLFLVTPSGVIYEEMTTGDVMVIDRECKMVEGVRKPSSDSPALVYMFGHMPHISALIHAHQPYATAAEFVANQIPEFLVTLIDASGAAINVTPFTPSSDISMGIMAVKCAEESRVVILKHHGIMAYGADMKEVLYSAIYLEEAAKTFILTKVMGTDIPLLAPEGIAKEKRDWLDYG